MQRDRGVLALHVVPLVRIFPRNADVERRLAALEAGAREVLAGLGALVAGAVRVPAVGAALSATLGGGGRRVVSSCSSLGISQ